jgi:hypothetical protein
MTKAKLINEIRANETLAISLGFDFPSQDPETATIAELESFLEELKEFVAQA